MNVLFLLNHIQLLIIVKSDVNIAVVYKKLKGVLNLSTFVMENNFEHEELYVISNQIFFATTTKGINAIIMMHVWLTFFLRAVVDLSSKLTHPCSSILV